MSRVAYVNGRYVPHRAAMVHVEDRGYQFADGVYEVVTVRGGRLIDEEPHLDRLDRSLGELRIASPMTRGPLKVVLREVLRRNGVTDGIVYLQVTRGVARRDHPFPARAEPALVVTAARKRPPARAAIEQGVAARSVPDIRWKRCDIKSVSLLPNVLAKQQAREAGAYEAWLVDDEGRVTEGASTNAWIVTRDGELVTRPTGDDILAGITRASVAKLAQARGMRFVERPFTLDEAKAAREAFITSATSFVLPIVKIDDAVIGNGRAGSIALALADLYDEYAETEGASA